MPRKTIMTNIAYDTQRRSYYVSMYGGRSKTGQFCRTVRCYPTLDQAVQALENFKAGKSLGQGKVPRDLTVGQWLHYWLEQVVRPSRSASTTHGYTMIIRNHLIPALGNICLADLTAAQVQQYLNHKQEEGLCANTVRKHHSVLHNALEQARKQELIDRNVVEMAARPSATQPVHHYYDAETMQRLFQALEGTSMELAVKLAIWACGAAKSAASNGAMWTGRPRSLPLPRLAPPSMASRWIRSRKTTPRFAGWGMRDFPTWKMCWSRCGGGGRRNASGWAVSIATGGLFCATAEDILTSLTISVTASSGCWQERACLM